MNQYERGKHEPDWLTVERLAAVLEVPVAFLFAEDEDAAALLLAFYALPTERRADALKLLQEMSSDSGATPGPLLSCLSAYYLYKGSTAKVNPKEIRLQSLRFSFLQPKQLLQDRCDLGRAKFRRMTLVLEQDQPPHLS
jgi:transcriptional regulator with XRE-family HTH domain